MWSSRREPLCARARVGVLAVAMTVSACGDDGDDVPCGSAQPFEVTRAAQEHACLHVVHGPFETVPATKDEPPPPELRNTHVAYTVELPGDVGARAGQVMFKPRETARFAFFLDSDTPLSLLRPGGATVCAAATNPVPFCEGLRQVQHFDLARKVEYHLNLGPAAPARVLVIVEPVVAEASP